MSEASLIGALTVRKRLKLAESVSLDRFRARTRHEGMSREFRR